MTTLTEALNIAAPLYNLALVIVILYLFYKLFSIKNKKVNLRPWRFVLLGVLIYIVEEVLTILRATGTITLGRHVNGFFELAIVILFIYTLLEQKELVEQETKE